MPLRPSGARELIAPVAAAGRSRRGSSDRVTGESSAGSTAGAMYAGRRRPTLLVSDGAGGRVGQHFDSGFRASGVTRRPRARRAHGVASGSQPSGRGDMLESPDRRTDL